MNTFECYKCKKQSNPYGAMIFLPFVEYSFCNDCGNKISPELDSGYEKLFKRLVWPDRLSPEGQLSGNSGNLVSDSQDQANK